LDTIVVGLQILIIEAKTDLIIFTAEFPSDKASAKENVGNTYEKGRYLFYLGRK